LEAESLRPVPNVETQFNAGCSVDEDDTLTIGRGTCGIEGWKTELEKNTENETKKSVTERTTAIGAE
jgi:hypothetical protein